MDENRLLLSRLDDLIYKSYCGEIEGFGFLNELEVSIAHNYLNNQRVQHSFYGGYKDAIRMYLYLTDDIDYSDDIIALEITPKGDSQLTHRDYLGSLMGLGITRECVGDILIKESSAIAFVRKEICDYIKQNLSSVGKISVSVSEFIGDLNRLSPEYSKTEVLLSSMRIDNFVSSVCNFSRQKSAEYISSDYVFINYSCVDKTSKALNTGDTVSIRGFGKFKIGEIIRNTKSGRIVLSVLQYK